MRTKTVAAPLCECGCGENTKGQRSRFLPGHDAKLKKVLIKAALDGSKRATTKLDTLGWSKFLDAKRKTLATKKTGNATEPKIAVPSRGRNERRPAGRPKRSVRHRKKRGGEVPSGDEYATEGGGVVPVS